MHEATGLARDTSQPQYGLTGELVVALATALRGGTEPEIESVLAEPERALLAMKSGPLLATAHLARGAAAIGDGRHEEAFQHLWPVFDETDSAFHRFMRWPALLDLVEAATGRGQTSRLIDVIADLEAISAHSEPPILRLSVACAQPLILLGGSWRLGGSGYPCPPRHGHERERALRTDRRGRRCPRAAPPSEPATSGDRYAEPAGAA